MTLSMRLAGLLTLAIFFPMPVRAAVVINEIAWMGSAASANAEWMELYNSGSAPVDLTNWHLVAANGSPSLTLAGSIAANGFFLLERTSDASVPTATADQIYTGALTNSGTTLTLSDASGSNADEVIGGANWVNVGGDNASKETAQRTASGWETAVATPRAINAGVSNSSSNSSSSSSATSTTTAPAVSSSGGGGGPPEYIPIPMLRIVTTGDRSVSSGADTAFTAVVYDGKGNRRNDALVTWSFGDGMRKTGASVFHTYYNPGEYLAVAHASTSDGGDALAEVIVTVQDAGVKIVSVSPRGINLMNSSTRTTDLSLWRLSAGGKEFKIPEDTQILAGRSVLFPFQVIGLPLAGSALLLYPSGEVADVYPAVAFAPAGGGPASGGQPSPSMMRYKKVSEVEPISSASTEAQIHEEAVDAPAATTELAAAGAALPSPSPAPAARIFDIFKSPWTLGLLGVITLAGGAFIFL